MTRCPPKDPMKTVAVEVYRPGVQEPIWAYKTKFDEFVRVSYMQWGVVVDIASSYEDLQEHMNGTTRKIFHGCSVIEDLERDEEKSKEETE